MQIRSSKRCAKIFSEANRSRDVKLSVILRFQKIVLLHKIKFDRQKARNFAHRFGDNYLTDHLVKFCKIGLNPEELELLEYAMITTFFNENR